MEKYNITGMSCAACSARVEKAVSKVEGVDSCVVSLLTNSMSVEGTATSDAIIKAVQDAGYGASLQASKSQKTDLTTTNDTLKDRETPKLLRRFIISCVFLLVLMYFSMGHMMWHFPAGLLEHNHTALGLLQMLLTIAIIVINNKFFTSGFKAVLHRAPNMDTLVSLGAGVAFVYSVVSLFRLSFAETDGNDALAMSLMNELYFESAGMILTLITLGKTLESYSKGKTTNALKGLMNLAPKTATVLRDGKETEIRVEDLKKGDVFLVRPGESIPVDGIVLDGASAVNEASLTGESIPVDKVICSSVSAGTMNTSGFIKCEATRVGEDTTLSQIIKMVSDAAATKAPIAKIADKVSGIFVPTILAIALLTFIIWMAVGSAVGYALARAIAVLVISCPCALGLATPVAIMVGSGVGAKAGILFKTAASLEETGRTQIVVLDKTGTVTSGEPRVTDILPFGIDEAKLVSLAYSLEAKSEHPLAKAVCAYAESITAPLFEIKDFNTTAGSGLSATFEGQALVGGNLAFIKHNASGLDGAERLAEDLAKQGKTPLFFALGGQFVGIIAVADVIKEDGKQAVAELKNMGIRVVMLTGDNPLTADAIGKQAGIDEIVAGVLPDGKAEVVEELKKQGKVAMVGDGVNDAPALTAADIGIAIGAGTDVAIDAASVVLMGNRLADVPAAIRLGRATLRVIHQNLFWAFIYNALLIPFAAGAFAALMGWAMDPMYGAAAMSLSSFCVVMNALRLNLKNIHSSKHDHPTRTLKKRQNKQSNACECQNECPIDIKETLEPKEAKENKSMEKTMQVEGMMCTHCEARVQKALEKLEGVESAKADHVSGKVVVTLSKDVANDVLKQAVEEQDYDVKGIE